MTSDKAMAAHPALQDPATARAAVDWFVRQQDEAMPSAEWLAFSGWLAADPRHGAAFEAVVELDGKLDGLDAGLLAPANDEDEEWSSRRQRPWLWVVASAAAVLVLALAIWPRGGGPAFETIMTAPGEMRTIALDRTIRIDLNGATRLAVARGTAPVVRIEQGEAAFTINSPAPSKLRVEADGLTITDKGTSFDVIRDSAGIRVAVGSGRVAIAATDRTVDLAAGQVYERAAGSTAGTLGTIAPGDMASWRDGRLYYLAAPLPVVASDLSRALGVTVSVAPGLSQARFTGVVRTDRPPKQAVSEAAALAGATVRRKGQGFELAAP